MATQAQIAAAARMSRARQARLPSCPITGTMCARDCGEECQWGAEPMADGYPCASPARPLIEALYKEVDE